ncbi:MAG: hypothetical protein IJB68_05960 [Ruminococcus sp.]|nr:hypothetical protein [Ruminococcus sp.]
MKKLISYFASGILLVGGFKMIILEPDKPHTIEITIPSFNSIVEFFEKVSDAANEVAEEVN